MVNFSGKWVFDHAENMKAVGDALKIDWSKIPEDKTTTTEITQNGDNFHIKTTTAARTRDVSRNYMVSFFYFFIVLFWEGLNILMSNGQ